MLVLWSEWAVQRDNVRFCQQFIQRCVPNAGRAACFVRDWVKRQRRAIESDEDFRNHATDFTRADNADGLTVHVEPEQPLERKVTFAYPVVRAMQFAI